MASLNMLEETDSDEELPPGWEERATLEGDVFYVNHVTKSTQWNHPLTGRKKCLASELPYGWEIQQNDDGTVIFKDTINNRTTYTDPRLAFAEEIAPKRKDFKQRYDGHTTAMQIVMGRDFRGKFAIVTGSNTGIGFETARSLALHGCHVIIASRDRERCQEAIKKITDERPEAQLTFIPLDLADLGSVRAFVNDYLSHKWPLNYLILNAGVFSPPHTLTKDGHELCFQVNHLAHFYLTRLLLPLLQEATPPARVVVLSSESHRTCTVTASTFTEDRLDPTNPKGYHGLLHYGTTKLCNIMFTLELHRRYHAETGVIFLACHPGNMVNTDLSRNWWVYRWLFYLVKPFTKSLNQGAATSLYCAVHRDMESMSGSYLNNCCVCKPSDLAVSETLATQLWTLSDKMIERFEQQTHPPIDNIVHNPSTSPFILQ